MLYINININIAKLLTHKPFIIMKKNVFALAAFLMFSSVGLANTHEIKKEKKENLKNVITNKLEKKDKDLTICYEINRTERQINEFVTEVTTTYQCFTHPGLGTGTVYIDAQQ